VARAGYEHRFYMDAGKYTGIFWNVTPAEAQELPYLQLISLEALRDKARATSVKGLTLPEPGVGRRPQKPE
jgi:hypothetical protein